MAKMYKNSHLHQITRCLIIQNEQTTISQTYMLIVEDAAQFFKAHQMHLL